jgi:hypothetical protein
MTVTQRQARESAKNFSMDIYFIVLQPAICKIPLHHMMKMGFRNVGKMVSKNIISDRYDKCMARQLLWSGDDDWW